MTTTVLTASAHFQKTRVPPLSSAWAARFLLLLLLGHLLPLVVQAQFGYTTNNGTITITSYDCSGGAAKIPTTINGLPVTRIGERAFIGCTTLTSVTIPDGVTDIESAAFNFCTSLVSVTIPDSVTRIGYGAFASCTSLPSIALPNRLKVIEQEAFRSCTGLGGSVMISASVTSIGSAPFADCASLMEINVDALNPVYRSENGVLFSKDQTQLHQYPAGKAGPYTMPNSVTHIELLAFSNCTNLTRIQLSDSVTRIDFGAFDKCSSLTELNLPGGVVVIEQTAFSGCTGLTSIHVPKSVTSIGKNAFFACTRLQEIEVDPLNPMYRSDDGVLYDHDQSALIQYPAGKTGSYTLPATVPLLPEGAFWACGQLTRVAIPDGITRIEASTFNNCTNLTSVAIPDTVTFIGEAAFLGCNHLIKLRIPAGVSRIARVTFGDCASLDSITIPDGVTEIADGAFSNCRGLTKVTLPRGLTNIAEWTFYSCSRLRSIVIPSSVKRIGAVAFSDCKRLKSVLFDGDAVSIDSDAFSNSTEAIVYYLPGAIGWSSTLANRPVRRWQVGLWGDGFRFTIDWPGESRVIVDARANVDDSVWLPASTNALTDGSTYFTDPQWTNFPSRLFRLRLP